MKLRFKYGLQMLLRNPVRMIASFITAIAALGIAGMCVFVQSYNAVNWERDLYFNHSNDKYLNISIAYGAHSGYNGRNYDVSKDEALSLEQDIREIGGEYVIQIVADYADTYMGGSMTSLLTYFGLVNIPGYFASPNADRTVYGEYNGETLIAPYPSHSGSSGDDYHLDAADREVFNDFYARLAVYSSEAAVEEFGYELVGRLPEKKDEVAIPQWLYNCFLCYGYKDASGNTYEISSEADIIGKELKLAYLEAEEHWFDEYVYYRYHPATFPATIVGVIHTDYAAENFEESFRFTDWMGPTVLAEIDSHNRAFPAHVGIAVSREYWLGYKHDVDSLYAREGFINNITVLREGEYKEEYFNYITAWKSEMKYLKTMDYETMGERHVVYSMPPAVNKLYQSGLMFVFWDTAIYFNLVPYLGVFAAVLLMYLCFSTVMGKRRGVGIMQSMGASKWQVVVTIGVPLLLFCLMCSLGALCVELGFLSYMNGQLTEVMTIWLVNQGIPYASLPYPFTLGWQIILFTFGVPLLIVAVTTLVTVWLVFRTPVVDNLNKKDFRLFRKKVKTNPFTDHPWSGT